MWAGIMGKKESHYVPTRDSTSTIHLDGHPDYIGSADEITPLPRTLTFHFQRTIREVQP